MIHFAQFLAVLNLLTILVNARLIWRNRKALKESERLLKVSQAHFNASKAFLDSLHRPSAGDFVLLRKEDVLVCGEGRGRWN